MLLKLSICVIIILWSIVVILKRSERKLDAEIAAKKKAKEEAEEPKYFTMTADVFTPDDIPRVKDVVASPLSFVHFQTEPDNPYDSKAIRVMSGDDCLGYVFRGRLQDTLHEYAEAGRSKDVSAYVSYVSDEEDLEEDDKILYRIKVQFKK